MRAPCLGVPSDIEKLIDAGHGDKIKMTLWGRICNAGDLTLVTGQDQVPVLVLEYLDNPRKVEQEVYALIRR